MPGLDGLRGVAILMVLLCHADGYMYQGFPHLAQQVGPLPIVLGMGWCGVDLFFVLSGFLITGILLGTKGAPHYFKSFFARRALRIYPLYYCFLFVLMAIEPHWYGRRDWGSLLLYFSNFRMVQHHHGFRLVGSFWSLAVEEQF